MAGRNLELDVRIGGELDSSLTGSTRQVIRQAQQMSRELQAINRACYNAQQEAANLRGIQGQIQRYQELTRAIQRSRQAYLAGGAEARAAGAALRSQARELTELKAKLDAAGYSTRDFAESQARLQEELRRNAQLQEDLSRRRTRRENYEGARGNLADAHQKLYNATGNWQAGLQTSIAIVSPFTDAIKDAMVFESVMADVKKVVDFETPQQFKAMSEDILNLSTVLPMAAEDIAKIVAAGGQSGIAQKDLMSFAEAATKMGIAFDITADQAGDMMAKWRTAFKMNQEEVVGLADKINYLGNTTAAAAPLISDVITRVGPLGEVGGVASGEIAALGASMIGVGIPSDVAATGIKNLVLSMVAGEGATKSQAAAFRSLGMDAVTMSKRMQKDAKGAIMEVFTALQSLDKDKQASTLQALFGKESLSAISPLLSNLENLQDNFNKVADAQKYAGSMESEYAARSQTTEFQLQRAKNAISNVSKTIGNEFLPIVAEGAKIVAENGAYFAKWIGQHKEIIMYAGAAAVALAGLIMTALTVQVAIAAWGMLTGTFALVKAGAIQAAAAIMEMGIATKISAGIATLKKSIEGLAAGTRIATAAQWALNSAVLANPYVLAAVAIIGLLVAISLLIANFDELRNIAEVTFNHISGTVAAWVEKTKLKFDEAMQKLAEVWNSITGDSLKGSEVVLAIFNNVAFYIGATFDVICGIIGTIAGVIINILVGLAQMIGGVVNVIAGIFSLDWRRIWEGAGQVADGAAGTIVNTIGNLVLDVKSIFDTLKGESSEVEAEAKKAREAIAASGDTKTAQEAQATATALNDAGVNAGTMAANVQQTAESAGLAKGNIEQLNVLLAQTPQTMTDLPQNAQMSFSQLPPMTAQTTDQMAAEFAKFTQKCQPGADAFVQASNTWGEQAYQNIANWSSQMAQVVTDKLTTAWAQISAQFSAGLNVSVTTTAVAANVAHNASGGIYNKGAFLTTFAERSAEAAIPLDGSERAVSLWRQTGEMLGLSNENDISATPIISDFSGENITIEYHAPTINIQGNADQNTVAAIKSEFNTQKRDFENYIERAIERIAARKRRLSYE